MSAAAPLTPSQSPPMLLSFYRYKGDKKENNIIGNTAQMSWCDGECIFCQMRLQKSKVYWR